MNHPVSLSKGAVCAQYKILLNECEAALEVWDEWREQIAQTHFRGKQVGNELLRLQADYAKAYTTLRTHVRRCEICQSLLSNDARGLKGGVGTNCKYKRDDGPTISH